MSSVFQPQPPRHPPTQPNPPNLPNHAAQKFAQSLSIMPSQRISQLLWAFAQFGSRPPPSLLASIIQSASAALVTYPPESMAQLLSALQSFGCALANGPLLQAAADRATPNVTTLSPASLVELLAVFADSLFHPGGDLLHAAAVQLSNQLSAAEASGAAAALLSPRHAASLMRSYATLAYAPPTVLLQHLQHLLVPRLRDLEPSALAALLWGYQLFRALSPALWNPACEVLAAAQGEGVGADVLGVLYQVR